jgi:hypothetical protein
MMVRNALLCVLWKVLLYRVCSRTGSALVLLYGTTNTMEHHHFNHAVMILSSEVRQNF